MKSSFLVIIKQQKHDCFSSTTEIFPRIFHRISSLFPAFSPLSPAVHFHLHSTVCLLFFRIKWRDNFRAGENFSLPTTLNSFFFFFDFQNQSNFSLLPSISRHNWQQKIQVSKKGKQLQIEGEVVWCFEEIQPTRERNERCNECNSTIVIFRYKFRLNCFTNDMSRVFSSHYEIIDDIENVFRRGVSLATGKVVHILRLGNFRTFLSEVFETFTWRDVGLGLWQVCNLCYYFIPIDWCFNNMRFLYCGGTEAWFVFCIAQHGMRHWAILSRKNHTVSANRNKSQMNIENYLQVLKEGLWKLCEIPWKLRKAYLMEIIVKFDENS